MKARYLTFFSYIGTSFRSSEKIWLKDTSRHYPDPQSIQGVMEMGLLKLRSLNYPNLTLSSRTDGGVHALNTTAHFDLEKFGTSIYYPDRITYELNKFFYKNNLSIFVKKCLRVPNDFSARYNAKSRTYLYRLAVTKPDVVIPEHSTIASYIPVEEWRRCHFLRLASFDIERFKEGAKYFEGYHDFTTFKKFDKLKVYKHNRRQLFSITVTEGQPLVTSYSRQQDGIFDYYDIEIKGRSFVHNQIRRMVGTLISVAIGKLNPEDIKVMLQVPSKQSWHDFISTGPAHGLYLCDIEYDPAELVYEKKETSFESDSVSCCDIVN